MSIVSRFVADHEARKEKLAELRRQRDELQCPEELCFRGDAGEIVASIRDDGNLECPADNLSPAEALRFGQWLVTIYVGDP